MKKLNSLLLFIFICLISLFYYKTLYFDKVNSVIFQGILLFLIPLSIAFSFKIKRIDLGLTFDWKKILLYSLVLIGIAIPIMWYASTLQVFQDYYPRFIASDLNQFLYAELLLLPMFFFLEFFYRGFALFQLKKYVGNWAILLQALPYTLIHFGKPGLELYYSFFAGLVFAYVCLKTKSFLPAFISHYISSAIFDYLCW